MPTICKNATVAACALALFSQPAAAIDKIYSPHATKGEVELEYSGSTSFDNNHAKNNIQEHEFELEYGLTDRIMLELAGSFEKQPDQSVKSSAIGFGGRYEFFEPGEAWMDSGLLLTYGRATHSDTDADAIEAKLLLEKQWGKLLHRANIGIEQEVGSHRAGGPDRVFLWSSRYRYDPHFEPGFEIQSDFARANDHLNFNQQEHYIGPAIYGQIVPGLKYEAAYYFGATDAAARGAARVLVEYEVFF